MLEPARISGPWRKEERTKKSIHHTNVHHSTVVHVSNVSIFPPWSATPSPTRHFEHPDFRHYHPTTIAQKFYPDKEDIRSALLMESISVRRSNERPDCTEHRNVSGTNINAISNTLTPRPFLQSPTSIVHPLPFTTRIALSPPEPQPARVLPLRLFLRPARQKIWERDNYGWKRGYYLTNILLHRPREWMSKRGPPGGAGGGRGKGSTGGGARGCSYTNSPIKYNGGGGVTPANITGQLKIPSMFSDLLFYDRKTFVPRAHISPATDPPGRYNILLSARDTGPRELIRCRLFQRVSLAKDAPRNIVHTVCTMVLLRRGKREGASHWGTNFQLLLICVLETKIARYIE